VTSAKKSRKKGKTPPAPMAAMVPMISFTFSGPVVYWNRDIKGAGGIFFSSLTSGAFPTSFSSSVRRASLIYEED
jgi:hypothetical protein